MPNTYPEWRNCIEKDCGIKLTPDFAKERLQSLSNQSDPHTASFIKCYGKEYHEQVQNWFKQYLVDQKVSLS